MQISTMRPGLFVLLRTNLRGNVTYRTEIIEPDHLIKEGEEEGARRARWDTTRTVKDPDEHERGVKARSKARSLIQSVCSQSDNVGLLCLKSNQGRLDMAMEEAKVIVDEFNSTSTITKLNLFMKVQEVEADDVEAIRKINEELSDLMNGMAQGLENLNADKVRDAADRARNLGAMLTDSAKEKVQIAIDIGRKAAREIVKAGKMGVAEIDQVAIRKIVEARTAFLQLDDTEEMQAPEAAARTVDVDVDEPSTEVQPAPAQARMFDL